MADSIHVYMRNHFPSCWVYATLVIGSVVLSAYLWDQVKASPQLIVDSTALDLGSVWVTDSYVCSLPIQNAASASIDIDQFVVSCNCLKVVPTAVSIPPHGEAVLNLTLDLFPRTPDDAFAQARDFKVQIRPVVRQRSPHQVTWTLTGQIRNPFVIPVSATLEEVIKGSEVTRSLSITSHSELENISARADTGRAEVDVAIASDHRSFTLHVSPSSELPVGVHEIPILVSGFTRDGGPFPEIPIVVTISIVNDVFCIPESLVGGMQEIGTTHQAYFVLSSRTGSRFVVRNVQSSQSVQVSAYDAAGTLEMKASHRFLVTQKIADRGLSQATIRMQVETSGLRPRVERIEIPALYYGVTTRRK